MRIAITGATGFLGSALGPELTAAGHEVVRVTRGGHGVRAGDVRWDPARGEIDRAGLAGVEAAIHLAGEPIAERWNTERKRRIRDSRVRGTRLFAETLSTLDPRPSTLISASASGIYGNRGDEVLDETSAPGTGFLAEVAREWEAAADPAREAGIRVVHSRTGLVLHPAGGLLATVLPIFRAALGGRIGSGKQWLSWISLPDWIAAIRFALDRTVEGPVNVGAPAPVRNEEFTRVLGHHLHRPTVAAVPAFAVKLALGAEMAEETALASQRMAPRVLEREGFRFRHPVLADAIEAVLPRDRGR